MFVRGMTDHISVTLSIGQASTAAVFGERLQIKVKNEISNALLHGVLKSWSYGV
jgi:hypothetical protein